MKKQSKTINIENTIIPAESLRYIFDAEAIGESGTVVVCQNKAGELISYTTSQRLTVFKASLRKTFNMNFADVDKFKDPEHDTVLEGDTYRVHIVSSAVLGHMKAHSFFDSADDAPAGHVKGQIVKFKNCKTAPSDNDGYIESSFPYLHVANITELKKALGTVMQKPAQCSTVHRMKADIA